MTTAKTTTTRTTTTMTIFCLRLCHPNFAVLLLQEMWLLGNCQVYFVGDLLLNKKGFDWPVGTTALAARKRLQFDALTPWRCHQISSVAFCHQVLHRCGSQVIALSVQVFVFAGQAAKDQCGWSEGGYDGYGPVNYQTLPPHIPPVYLVSQMWQNCCKVWRVLGFSN